MEEKQFVYPLEPGMAMFNGFGALKPFGYQALYMQAVEPHLKNIGMDEATVMERWQVAWVLIAMTVEPLRPIRPGDTLHARTWNSTEKARLLFRREFCFYDEAETPVLRGATFSTLLDLKSRRVFTDRETIANFVLPAGEQLLAASDRLRMKTPEAPAAETLTARPSWEDSVGHVNNFRYGDLVYDALSETERASMDRLERLELYFVAETHPGDTLALHRVEGEDGTIVTVSQPHAPRPAFLAKLRFESQEE